MCLHRCDGEGTDAIPLECNPRLDRTYCFLVFVNLVGIVADVRCCEYDREHLKLRTKFAARLLVDAKTLLSGPEKHTTEGGESRDTSSFIAGEHAIDQAFF